MAEILAQRDQYALHLAMGLSDEDRVSVAEEAMERGGQVGQRFSIPSAKRRDAEAAGIFDEYGEPDARALQRQHSKDAEDFVERALGRRLRVEPAHWDLRGGGQAVTDGANYIGLAGNDTHAMTLLHELAHVMTGTQHGRGGHGPEFQEVVHRLYNDHIGSGAAQTFAGIMWPDRGATYG